MAGDRKKALDTGFNGFLAKPVALDAVCEEVRRLLKSK